MSRAQDTPAGKESFDFRAISHLIQRHLLWFLLGAYLIATVLPAPGLWIRNVSFGEVNLFQQTMNISLLMIMLAILMFNAGLGLKVSDLKSLMGCNHLLLTGL